MNNNDRFSCSGRLGSMAHALRGILSMARDQHNAWIHAVATAAVVLAGIGAVLIGLAVFGPRLLQEIGLLV